MLKIYTDSYEKKGFYPMTLIVTFKSDFNYPNNAILNFLVKVTDGKEGLQSESL